MLTAPPSLLEILRIQSGDNINISVESGRLALSPHRRSRYGLHELFVQAGPRAARIK